MRTLTIIILLFICLQINIFAQVENVPVSNPVYSFLLQIETKGILERYSFSQLPLQKGTIISALKLARENDYLLSNFEKNILRQFEREFQIVPNETAVAVYSEMDTNSVFSRRIWQDYDKYFYHYTDSNSNVSVIPLASIENINRFVKTYWKNDYPDNMKSHSLLLGTLGFRLSGTLSNKLGYYLQLTNTAMLKGDSSLALIDNKYATSKKFTMLRNDADVSESHITYQNDWFYANFGRETRLFGAGLEQKLIINNFISPTFDAITLKAKFKTFEYMFSHNSLINFPESRENIGYHTVIPQKYTAIHSFTFLPT
jgi:hypothetical protein